MTGWPPSSGSRHTVYRDRHTEALRSTTEPPTRRPRRSQESTPALTLREAITPYIALPRLRRLVAERGDLTQALRCPALPQDVLALLDLLRTKDVDAFIGLYAQNVRVFDLWSTWRYDGAAVWRGMVTGWFDSLGTAQVAVGWDGVQTLVGHDGAVVYACISSADVSARDAVHRATLSGLAGTYAGRRRAMGGWHGGSVLHN